MRELTASPDFSRGLRKVEESMERATEEKNTIPKQEGRPQGGIPLHRNTRARLTVLQGAEPRALKVLKAPLQTRTLALRLR